MIYVSCLVPTFMVDLNSFEDLMSRLLTNRLAAQCRHLEENANQTQEQMTLRELLLHYWIVINSTEANTLLEPLRCLVDEPQNMRVC